MFAKRARLGRGSLTRGPRRGIARQLETLERRTLLNAAPVATDDVFTIPAGYALERNAPALLANDTDADGNALHVSTASSPTRGDLTWQADGSFEYAPNAGFVGVDSFTYQAHDGTTNSNAATVKIRVGDYAQAVLEDDPLGYWRLDETNNQQLAVDASGNGLNGQYVNVQLGRPGAISAEPSAAGEWGNGNTWLDLRTPPQLHALRNQFTIEAWVKPDVLTGFHRVFTSSQRGSDGWAFGLYNNFILFTTSNIKDYVSAPLVTTVGAWYHLAVVFDGSNDASFFMNGAFVGKVEGASPADPGSSEVLIGDHYYGSQRFDGLIDEVALYDHMLTAADIQSHFQMGAVSAGKHPDLVDDTYSVDAGETLNVIVPSLPTPRHSFSTGFDGNALNANLEDPNGAFALADGALQQVARRRYVRTVKSDYMSGDFTYEVDVDMTTTEPRIMYVGVGDGVVNGQAYDEPINSVNFRLHTVGYDGMISIVFGNWTNGYVLGSISQPGIHRVRMVKTGNELLAQVDGQFNGIFEADVSYTVTDLAASAPFLNDTNSNLFFGGDLPSSYDNVYVESSLAPGAVTGVLDNDLGVDVETEALLDEAPEHGGVVLNPDGTFTYTPDAGFVGTDQFSYFADDGNNVSAAATVTIEVNGPPIVVADAYELTEDTTLTVGLPSPIPVVFDAVGDYSRAVNSDDARWSYRYSMDNDHNGDYPLLSEFDPDHLQLVGPWSPGPSPGAWRTPSENVPWIGVNDTGSEQQLGGIDWPDGTMLVHPPYPPLDSGFVAVSWLSPGDGELSMQFAFEDADYSALNGVRWYVERNNADGVLTSGAVPDGGSSGPQSLTDVQVAAGDRINFIVDGDNHSLGDNTLVRATIAFHPRVQSVLANDTDPNGDAFIAELVTDVEHGALDLLPDGSFTYQPDEDFSGADQFTYRAWDGYRYSGPTTVTLNVLPVNDLPTANNDEYELGPDGALSVNAASGVFANDLDPDSNNLTAVLVDQADYGTVTLNDDGSFEYQPNPGLALVDTFTYQVDDGEGLSNPAAVTLNRALPQITVGAHALVANTAGQTVSIYVTGGIPISGLNLFVQVGDGGPERVQLGLPAGVNGPAITDVNVKQNTIFASVPDNAQIEYVIPQVASASLSIAQPGGSVAADGLLATITLDTTGLLGGVWDLKLVGVLPDLQGGPFDSDFAGVPMAITNGQLEIVPATIASRAIFYAGSEFDDDPATDKQALLPGQTATFANYSSYVGGVNGIAVDIANALGTPNLNDFAFYVGNSNDTSTWQAGPAPSFEWIADGGTDGADRAVLRWADGAIAGKWLMVRVKSGVNTGLAADDIFYFGNAIGESGDNAANALVNATDVIGTRDHPRGPFNPASIDDRFDFNRDRLVNATDLVIARDHATSPLSALRLIRPTGALPAALRRAPTLSDRHTNLASKNDVFATQAAEKHRRARELAAFDAVFGVQELAPPAALKRRVAARR